MSFALHPLHDDDIPRCVSIYFEAFQNPHSLACWPRTPAVRAFWEQMIRDELHEPGAHWFKAVPLSSPGSAATSSSPDDGFAGFAKWVEPQPGAVPETQLPEWPAEADGDLCDETFGAWARQRAALMQARAHWCQYLAGRPRPLFTRAMTVLMPSRSDLEVVATAPAYQGRGAGSLMLHYGTDRADEQGVEACLEASPDAVPLYEKFGFREADRLDTWIKNDRVNGAWYSNLFMIRQSHPKES